MRSAVRAVAPALCLPAKRRAWLLLTPLTVAVDVLTFPLQLFAQVIIGC